MCKKRKNPFDQVQNSPNPFFVSAIHAGVQGTNDVFHIVDKIENVFVYSVIHSHIQPC